VVTREWLDDLTALETWMREHGAVKASVRGITLELVPLTPAPSPHSHESADERDRRLLLEAREEMQVRYMHTGGWNGDDEELKKLLGWKQ